MSRSEYKNTEKREEKKINKADWIGWKNIFAIALAFIKRSKQASFHLFARCQAVCEPICGAAHLTSAMIFQSIFTRKYGRVLKESMITLWHQRRFGARHREDGWGVWKHDNWATHLSHRGLFLTCNINHRQFFCLCWHRLNKSREPRLMIWASNDAVNLKSHQIFSLYSSLFKAFFFLKNKQIWQPAHFFSGRLTISRVRRAENERKPAFKAHEP